MVQRVLHTPTNQIKAIVLLPYPDDPQYSLVGIPVTVTSRKEIDGLNIALGSAKKFYLNHPGTKWHVVVRLVTSSGNVDFVVVRCFDNENGVFVEIMTKVHQGWNVGEFRNDDLGTVIEGIVARGIGDKHR